MLTCERYESGLVSQKWFFGSHRNLLSARNIFGGDSFKHFWKSIEKCSFLSPIEKLRMNRSATRRYPMFFISIEKMTQNCKWPTVLSVTAHCIIMGLCIIILWPMNIFRESTISFAQINFLNLGHFVEIFFQLYLLTAVPVFALPQITEPSHPVMAVGTNHLFDFWKIIILLYL